MKTLYLIFIFLFFLLNLFAQQKPPSIKLSTNYIYIPWESTFRWRTQDIIVLMNTNDGYWEMPGYGTPNAAFGYFFDNMAAADQGKIVSCGDYLDSIGCPNGIVFKNFKAFSSGVFNVVLPLNEKSIIIQHEFKIIYHNKEDIEIKLLLITRGPYPIPHISPLFMYFSKFGIHYGGNGIVTLTDITVSDLLTWEVSTKNPWIKISDVDGVGSGTFQVKTLPNIRKNREGLIKITFDGGKTRFIIVKQVVE